MKRILLLFLIFAASCAQAQFVYKSDVGSKPWIGKTPVVEDGRNFRFVVLPDRTGGERGGVFDSMIGLVNDQNPNLVINIGDLIDGYTTDDAYLKAMWKYAEASLHKFNQPVFLIPGNHDISNEGMMREWKRRFGTDYYHFTVGNNLFMALNTEEIVGSGGISEQQAAYFKELLQRDNYDHIFVFMHRPMWNSGSQAYNELEKMWLGKPSTVFAGHEHTYFHFNRDQTDYYMVATMGGGSDMRGVAFGELDHIMVVDVAEGKTTVRNIESSGAEVPTDIVTPDNIAMIHALLSGSWVSIAPSVADRNMPENIGTVLTFSNPSATEPLYIDAVLPENVSPREIEIALPPEATIRQPITLDLGQKGPDLEDVSPLRIEFRGSYDWQGKKLSLPITTEWLMDYNRRCGATPTRVECKKPQYVKEDWDWKGVDDGWFEFEVWCSDDKVHVRIISHDDKVITAEDADALQDKFFVHYMDANGKITERMLTGKDGLVKADGIEAATVFDLNGGKSIRLNIGFMDHDNPLNTKPSILWWRPLWGSSGNYEKSGYFSIE